MSDKAEKRNMKRWWTLSLVMALAAEVAVCLLLFAPQRRALDRLAQQKRLVEEQLGEAERAAAAFRNLEEQINQAKRVFALEMEFFADEPTRDAIMSAIVRANNSERIALLELAPAVAANVREPPSPCDSWKLRCRGDYRELTRFLSRLEGEGVLSDSRGFSVDAAGKAGVELQVVLRVLSVKALSRAVEESDSRPGGGDREGQAPGKNRARKGVESEA